MLEKLAGMVDKNSDKQIREWSIGKIISGKYCLFLDLIMKETSMDPTDKNYVETVLLVSILLFICTGYYVVTLLDLTWRLDMVPNSPCSRHL
jgi:hypothetical protein